MSPEHENNIELRQGVWRAIRLRLSLVLPVETMSGSILVVLEAVLLMRRMPHLRQFFHRYAQLPIAALLGARIGVLTYLAVVPLLVLRSIRVYKWSHADSQDAYSDFVRPCLRLLCWIALVQNVLEVAVCAHALCMMLGSSSSSLARDSLSRGRCVQSSSEVWLCLESVAGDAWPIAAVAATAGLAAVCEAFRIGFWRGALDELHALDVDVGAARPRVLVRVPAKRRPRCASEEGASCCICLADFEAEEPLAELRCGHCYHEACIRTWLCRQERCPLRCPLGAVRHRVPPALGQGAGLAAGARARVGDTAQGPEGRARRGPWRHGTVVSTAPLLVRPDGWLYARPWELVEAVLGEGAAAPAPGHEHEG